MSDLSNLKDLLEASKKILNASLSFDWEQDSKFGIAEQNLSMLVEEIEEDLMKRKSAGVNL